MEKSFMFGISVPEGDEEGCTECFNQGFGPANL